MTIAWAIWRCGIQLRALATRISALLGFRGWNNTIIIALLMALCVQSSRAGSWRAVPCVLPDGGPALYGIDMSATVIMGRSESHGCSFGVYAVFG